MALKLCGKEVSLTDCKRDRSMGASTPGNPCQNGPLPELRGSQRRAREEYCSSTMAAATIKYATTLMVRAAILQ
jgi:hypothetical protein